MVWFRLKPRRLLPKWPEVRCINDFAAFLGGVAMVIRGLGFLVVTWTTVVLLGGFVSQLKKKDFWSLTVITFIQIARVVNNYGREKWNSVALSGSGLDAAGRVLRRDQWATTVLSSGNTLVGAVLLFVVACVETLLRWIAWSVQTVTYIVVLSCSFSVILVLGPYIATGVSLWRLRQHDYGKADGDPGKANMNPALHVLYIIVVVQGALFIYRMIIDVLVAKKLVAEVAEAYGFEGPRIAVVEDYMKEIRKGCVKNPSFAKGRNLVTYAVGLMGPDKSPGDNYYGLIVLSTIIRTLRRRNSNKFVEQRLLIRQLMLYAPSSHIFHHLLVLSNTRSARYPQVKQREVRKHAATIVMHLAEGASPEQLPQVIQCMSSLIGTFQAYQQFFSSKNTSHASDDAEMEDYMDQLAGSLQILSLLAADENNCRLIIHTPGLLTKIMTPLASNLHHQSDHGAWGVILVRSLQVLKRLTTAYGHGEGETGVKLFREIQANLEVGAVEAMMRILRCDQCSKLTETLVIGIVTNLHMHMQPASREDFIEKLADIYTPTTTNSTRIPALEALATLCFQDRRNAATILQVNGSAVYSFTGDLEALSDGYQRHHRSVAEILEQASLHYTRDDECLRVLRESMTDVMPKVLNKILTAEATQTGQQGDASQTNGQSRSSSSLQEQDTQKTETALLSLCVTIHETFISADQHLALQFDSVIDASSLPLKLRGMVLRNSGRTVGCLKILKLTSNMVISMMKCRGSRYPKEDLESLVEALSRVCSLEMRVLDSSMDFARGDNTDKIKKPERSLWSFVTEVTDLVKNYRELEVMSPSTIVGGELSSN